MASTRMDAGDSSDDAGRSCACGAKVVPGAHFCAWCGRALSVRSDRLGEQRRTVTALFADLSNFSRLVSTTDAEDLLAAIDPVIAALSTIVDRHGGYVEKFAGDALLALFGAPVTHEDDPLRAVQAACDMHGYLAGTRVHPIAADLLLHVGVGTGPVIARTIGSAARTDYAVLGEAVVIAQRLQSLAGPGETYLDEATARLVEEEFALSFLGPLAVKGRDDPVPAYRLLARSARRRATTTRPMVGRDRELDQLLAALGDAAAGRTIVRCVTGSAGSGKTQLLAHLRERAGAGVTTIELAASSVGATPYRTLRPLVDQALAARLPAETSRAARLARAAAEPALPAAAAATAMLLDDTVPATGDLAELTPQALRRTLQAAVLAWCRDLARRQPLLVTIDNAQWLDEASVEVLDALAHDWVTIPVLVCVAGRSIAGAGLLEAARLELEALPVEALGELIATELGLSPDPRLVTFVHDRSGGNPLVARETLHQLAALDLLDQHHGHVRLMAGAEVRAAAAGLSALLAARVDALSTVAAETVTVAAVVGLAAPLSLLAEMTGISAPAAEGAAEELAQAGLAAVVEGWLRLDTPVLRDVLYGRLTGRQRRELHGGVARELRHVGASDALLAEHLDLAGDAAGALPLLRRVAERSRRLFDHDATARALARAVGCARRCAPGAVPELLCELADVRDEAGEYAAAEALFAEAAALDGDARAWAGQAAARRRAGNYAGALTLLDQALSADVGRGHPPTGDLRLIYVELAWSHSVAGNLAASRAAADAGLALQAAEVDEITARLLLQRVRVATLLDDLERASADADRAVAILQTAGDAAGMCTALRLLGDVQQRGGDLDEAARTLERGLAAAERAGLVEERGGCLVNLGLVHGARGDHRAASSAYASAAVVFEQVGHVAGCATAYGNRAYELMMLDDLEAARGLAMSALALAEQIGHHLSAADVLHTLALIAERLGEHTVARRHAEQAVAEFVAAGLPEAAGDSRELVTRMAAQAGDDVG